MYYLNIHYCWNVQRLRFSGRHHPSGAQWPEIVIGHYWVVAEAPLLHWLRPVLVATAGMLAASSARRWLANSIGRQTEARVGDLVVQAVVAGRSIAVPLVSG